MLTPYIVRHVKPGTPCSYPTGDRIVECHSDTRRAEQLAQRYNECAAVSGIAYRVELFDDSTDAPIPLA